jgi:hypothetical protein
LNIADPKVFGNERDRLLNATNRQKIAVNHAKNAPVGELRDKEKKEEKRIQYSTQSRRAHRGTL